MTHRSTVSTNSRLVCHRLTRNQTSR